MQWCASCSHTPASCCLVLQETPEEFLALLGEAPAFQGLPKLVEMPRARARRLLDPSAPAEGDGDAAAAAANGDAMQQDEQPQGGDADEAAAAAAEGGDAAAQQGEAGAMDVDKAAEEQQQQEAAGGEGQQQQPPAEQQDPAVRWSGRLLGVLQARYNTDGKPFTTEQVLLWMEQEQVRRRRWKAPSLVSGPTADAAGNVAGKPSLLLLVCHK